MNERIKELAEQAGYSKDYLEIGLPSNMEKFAQLIVQECADWIDRQDETRCPYGVDLVEHFGVR